MNKRTDHRNTTNTWVRRADAMSPCETDAGLRSPETDRASHKDSKGQATRTASRKCINICEPEAQEQQVTCREPTE